MDQHLGVLTDGKTWTFYYVVQDQYYDFEIVADSRENVKTILGKGTYIMSANPRTTH
jgi:hypothetical protein